MYYCADVQAQAYNESWDVVPGVVRAKGWGFVNNDIFGFLLKACLSITEEVTKIFRHLSLLILMLLVSFSHQFFHCFLGGCRNSLS